MSPTIPKIPAITEIPTLASYASYSTQEKLSCAYRLADVVERHKTQVAAPQLNLAVSLLRQNISKNSQEFESQLLLARLLLWVDGLTEAISLCENVLAFKEFDYLALHIRGIARLQSGNISGAVDDLALLQCINPHHGLLAWNLANAYFHAGKIEEGWKAFECANVVLPNTYPEISLWAGEELAGKNIVLTQYNSNGGGDDLIFAQIIPDVLNKSSKCFIEVDARSEPLYRRSFNQAVVFKCGEAVWTDNDNIDYQVMVPTLATILRKNPDDFDRPAGYLKVDNNVLNKWDEKLSQVAGDTVRVGICWRSLISIGLTGTFSSRIEDWAEVFKVPNVTFFELQYDESEEERIAAEELFGVKIHQFKNIDLMTDFDQIATISLALDIVISAVTTIDIIANAVGANVWEIRPSPSALCMSILPWFPNRKIFSRKYNQNWEEVLGDVAINLQQFVSRQNGMQARRLS